MANPWKFLFTKIVSFALKNPNVHQKLEKQLTNSSIFRSIIARIANIITRYDPPANATKPNAYYAGKQARKDLEDAKRIVKQGAALYKQFKKK